MFAVGGAMGVVSTGDFFRTSRGEKRKGGEAVKLRGCAVGEGSGAGRGEGSVGSSSRAEAGAMGLWDYGAAAFPGAVFDAGWSPSVRPGKPAASK